jgi:hypothetical protein
MALDARWNHDGRAETFLRLSGFLRDEAIRTGQVAAVYAHDGTVVQRSSSLVGMAGAVAALLTLDPPTAQALHAQQIVGRVQYVNGGLYWGDPEDLYAQEWGWFSTALYADALPDLWTAPAAQPGH